MRDNPLIKFDATERHSKTAKLINFKSRIQGSYNAHLKKFYGFTHKEHQNSRGVHKRADN
jgi:hypothetical protein